MSSLCLCSVNGFIGARAQGEKKTKKNISKVNLLDFLLDGAHYNSGTSCSCLLYIQMLSPGPELWHHSAHM